MKSKKHDDPIGGKMSGAAEVENENAALLATYRESLAEAHAGPREQIGERLFRTFLTYWEDPRLNPQFVGSIRAGVTTEEGAAQLRGFLSSELFRQVADEVSPLNLNAAAAQVIGVAMLRYLLEAEPIASASEDELVDLIAPTIQRYLGD
jgi:hypothetical protein